MVREKSSVAYDDLRDWIKTLEKHGELKRVHEEVSPELEITEITDRMSKAGSHVKGSASGKYAPGGPALLFENVAGHPGHKVFINQFGSERRMAMALGVDRIDEIAQRISGLMNVKAPEGLFDKLKMLPQLGALSAAFPKTVSAKEARCKEVVLRDNFDLNQFPILKCWPHDGGRFITLPCVHTRNPVTGKRNIGMYRMQVYDGQTTGMHWQRQKVAAEHYREAMRAAVSDRVAAMAESAGGAVSVADGPIGGLPQVSFANIKNSRLEVAVAIGTDPATTFSAIVPAPPEVEEFMIAGFLRGKPVEIVKCETVDLEVPAHAEIILEGYVELGDLRAEGPFGDHTGFYTMTDEYPVFRLTGITHRRDPIYAATIVGKPPMEDAWLGKATERIFLPLLQMVLPEVVDMNLPVEGGFHNLAIVSIRKSYPGHAKKVMNALAYVGVLTIEFFVVKGRLIANEMAPRVHNSGHWTIEGCVTSQFENHLRAICDLPLGSTRALGHAAMINFLGKMPDRTRLLALDGLAFHDYGKDPRPGRKLGHCTILKKRPMERNSALADALKLIEWT